MNTKKGKAPDTGNIRGSTTSKFCNLNNHNSTNVVQNSPSLLELSATFRQVLLDHIGHAPNQIDTTGQLKRFSSNGKKDDKAGWYVCHKARFTVRNKPSGQPYDIDGLVAVYGDWRLGFTEKWISLNQQSYNIDPESYQRIRQIQQQQAQQLKAEQKTKTEQGRRKATQMWQSAQDANPEHPYLLKKRVGAYGIRQLGDNLLIPVCDLDGLLHGLQLITPQGKKRFLSGTAKRGHFHLIGNRLVHSAGVYLCEGYATGASLYEVYQQPVLVAFDDGNLLSVCRAYKQDYPHIPLTICADNDRKHAENPGLTKAREVCKVFPDVGLIVPEFPEQAAPENYSDFNDLIALLGSKAQENFAL